MFTVRAVSEKGFFARIANVKAQLSRLDYRPAPTRGAAIPSASQEDAPMCGIHGKPMQRRQGRNGSFWSCPEKFANGEYCNFKPK
jgi:hypothetical protein